jgi:hypothetical protein
MADVIKFTPRARVIPFEKIVEEATDDVSSNWERHVRVNLLNDYIHDQLPFTNGKRRSFTTNLNDVSWACDTSGMTYAVFSPGSLSNNLMGWVCIITIDGKQVSTPPMANELYARIFAVLLYGKIRRLM